jgi:hypothetical protein
MAFFKVLEPSFIGQKLCQPGEVVDINTDVDKGGMRPGKALAACDEEGNLSAAKPAAKPKAPKADAELG